MPSILIGLLEDLKGYEGKNGYGCTVTMSAKIGKKTKRVEFNIKDKNMASMLETHLDEEVVIVVGCNQSNFGTRMEDVIEFFPDVEKFLATYSEKYEVA